MAPRKKQNELATSLANMMAFLKVGHGQEKDGPQFTHTYMSGGWAFTFDSIIAAGHPLPPEATDINACPDTALFITALANVGKELTLAINDGAITVTSEKYMVTVPSIPQDFGNARVPDPLYGAMTDDFKTAMVLAARLVTAGAAEVRNTSVISFPYADNPGHSYSLVATNGKGLVEVWHGIDIPMNLVFPKQFAAALKTVDMPITGWGFGPETFTVFYANGAFIRTQLYKPEDYPLAAVTGAAPNMLAMPASVPVPTTLLAAIKQAAPFSGEDRKVYLGGGYVLAGWDESSGEWAASIEVKDLGDGIGFAVDTVLEYADIITAFHPGDPDEASPLLRFMASTPLMVRGAAMGFKPPAPAVSTEAAPVFTVPDASAAAAAGWGQPSGIKTVAPAADPAPPAPSGAPSWATAPAAGASTLTEPAAPAQLPYTPRERQTAIVGAEAWDRQPYTLQPGETDATFTDPKNNEARTIHGLPLVFQQPGQSEPVDGAKGWADSVGQTAASQTAPQASATEYLSEATGEGEIPVWARLNSQQGY